MVHVLKHPRVILLTLDLALPAPALTYCLWTKREQVVLVFMSTTSFPQLKPILVLLVKQVLWCPIRCVHTWPCGCGLPSAGIVSLALHRANVTVRHSSCLSCSSSIKE